MNIYHFEDDLTDTILDKGYDYYLNDRVVDVYHQGDREYIIQVEGSDDYEVVVKLDENGEILHSHCDCPYTYGPICKHEVAAYYVLSDMLNSEGECEESDETPQLKLASPPELKEVLQQVPKEELIGIIMDVARKDAFLRNSLLLKYAKVDEQQELENCRRLIQSIVRKYAGRDEFIPYGSTADFTREMGEVFEKAGNTDNRLLAVDIALLLMEKAIEAFGYADDSDGDIGVMAEEALELVGEIAEESRDLDAEQRQRVFEKLMERSDGEIFEGWDEFHIGLLRICAGFADVEALRNKLRMKIEQLISQNAGSEHKDYSNEGMLRIWFEMIQQYGTPEEAEQFVVENLRFSFFREWYIKKFMQEGNFQKVVDLALEGEAQDQARRGLVFQWKKLRYGAYKRLSLKEEQKTLAEELLLDGDFGYYDELKQLAGSDTAALYHHLKQELQAKKDWQSKGLYLRLIEAENDLDELLEYVKEYPGEIEKYADRLAKRFEIEVIALYQQRIRLEASAASKRKEYQNVCGIIRRYQKIAGSARQRQMIEELSDLYSGKPAFLDELSQIHDRSN